MPSFPHPSSDIEQHTVGARDLAFLFVGKCLGYGQNRYVYEHEFDPTLVLKYEPTGDEFQNVLEWRVWQEVKDHKTLSVWFAPCIALSPNGVWLIQKKIKVLPKEKYPKKLPDFIGDTSYLNFGMLGKRFVCCDYGTPSIARIFWRSKMLAKVKWRGREPEING